MAVARLGSVIVDSSCVWVDASFWDGTAIGGRALPRNRMRRQSAQEGEQPESLPARHRLGFVQQVAGKGDAASRGRAIEAAAIFGKAQAAAVEIVVEVDAE